MKKYFLIFLLSVISIEAGLGQTTIFTETMGTVSSSTAIVAHETANGFDNDGLTMTDGGAASPADIRVTSPSNGYTGASGDANVYFTATSGERGFAIEGINTVGYINLKISFGIRKEGASTIDFATLAFEYSTDGTVWSPVTVSSFPINADGAGWYLISDISLPAGAEGQANLRLRWRKTGTIACRLDDVTLVGDNASCTAPATQASNIAFSNIALYSTTINWTNGDGSYRIVKMNTTNVFSSPVDGITYTSNAVYSGAGEQIIYVGTGNTINVSGLSPNTNYWFRVFEYNCTGTASSYQTVTNTNNPNNQTTLALCTNPTTQASVLTFPGATGNTINLSWTSGNGNFRIVIAKQGSVVTAIPVNSTTYIASSDFGSGTDIGTNEFVVYIGSGNSCTVTNLQIATTYYFAIFEYCAPTGNGSETYLTPPLAGNNTTLNNVPTKCLEIESILVDGCDGGNEGMNEMVRFQVGPNPINVSDLRADGAGSSGTIQIGKWPNSNNSWLGICTNATATSNLAILNNAILGCGELVEPPGGILPAGSTVVLITSTNYTPISQYFENLGESVFVIFQCAGNTEGHFKNYDPASSFRTLVINDISISCADTVRYDISLLTNQAGNPGADDGGAVSYDWDGTATYFNNGCQAPFEPVGVSALNVDNLTDVCINSILNISGEVVGTFTDLYWSTTGSGTFTDSASITTTYTPGAADVDQQIMLYLNATNSCGNVKDSVEINVYSLPVAGVTANDTVICVGDLLTLTATGGTSYVWSSGGSGSIISPNPTTDITYIVTVTENGCSSTDNITIIVHPNPVINIGANQDVCIGDTIILDALAGFTYNWSDGSSNQTFYVTTDGLYSVTITDGNTCTDRDTVAFTYHNPIVNLGNDTAACQNSTVHIDAGSGFTDYSWSTGASSQAIDVSATDTFSVTVTESHGCTDRDSITVTIHPNPVVTANASSDSICAGGSVTLTGGGATSYLWNNGATDGIAFTPAGTTTYTVTGTDVNSCTNTAQVTITVNPNPTVSVVTVDADCGVANGSATATGSGGSGGYLYSWSNGSLINTATGLAVGSYSVTVTDANTCKDSTSVAINENGAPPVTVSPNTVSLCRGESESLTASGADSYSWSPSDGLNVTTGDTVIATPNSSVVYTVTGTTNGCSAVATVTITVHDLPVVNLGQDIEHCGDTTFVLNAGAWNTYHWMPGNTSGQTISVSTTGTYSVTITDGNSCTDADSIDININPAPQLELGPNQQICGGGSVQLDAGAGFSYQWSTGAITDTITTDTAGTYSVTITDANLCTNSDAVTLAFYQNPVVDLGDDTVACQGASIVLDAGAGFIYHWMPGNSNDTTLAVTTTGVYSVTITDSHGCTDADSISVTLSAPPVVSTTVVPAACGMDNGSVAANAGSGSYTYQWSVNAGSQTTQTATGLAGGTDAAYTYYVTVNDGICTGTASGHVNIVGTPTILVNDTTYYQDSICSGDSIMLTASGADTYTWEPATGLSDSVGTTVYASPGSEILYTITGTTSGCSGVARAYIDVNLTPNVHLGVDVDTCGVITRILSPLDSIYSGLSYQWSPGTATSQTLTVNSSGTYSVMVTDVSSLCFGIDTINISMKLKPVFDLGLDKTICLGDSFRITIATGGSYLWNTGATTQSVVARDFGTYSVTVTNSVGCTGTDLIHITTQQKPPVDLGYDYEVFQDSTINFDAGNPGCTYIWSTKDSLQNISVYVVSDTTIFVKVTDINHCFNSDTIEVVYSGQIVIYNTFTPNGDGVNDTWVIKNIQFFPKATVEIYNRNGMQVFSTMKYKNNWDGKYRGKDLPAATYYYIIDLRDGSDVYKGDVTIIR